MKPLEFTDFLRNCQKSHVVVRIGSIEFRFWLCYSTSFFRRSKKCFSIIKNHGSKRTILTTSYCLTNSQLYATYKQLFSA